MNFELQFPADKISFFSERYLKGMKSKIKELEEAIDQEVVPRVRREGFLCKADFHKICRWKTGEQEKDWYKENDEDFIKAVSQTALSTANERLRIVAFGMLKGVDWPTASALLHFLHPDPYPILDPNAMRAVGLEESVNYDLDLWQGYTSFSRTLSKKEGIVMRDLYRALWQFGKENPKRKK